MLYAERLCFRLQPGSHSNVCAGSGKTLAYLLPTVQRVREAERCNAVSKPAAIVLVPSVELGRQILVFLSGSFVVVVIV